MCSWAFEYQIALKTWSMIRDNRQLVTNEPVEFEKSPVQVQDCRNITDQFRGIYRIYPNLIKENRRMSTCNQLGFANTRISTNYAQKSPQSQNLVVFMAADVEKQEDRKIQ